ncbi:signal recognition particle protein [Microbispora triticiradicis]|uniref:Signal recognition particle protein n=3 Tax=Microbispora TaxID=2005 RepID=A0ABY3LQI1_9ACTN|nr:MULTISPECIES: signal recognition particle protein [Microbispora]RGA01091.1 signal recognition particle protein [Microbispora triticiradicis]TLP51387.1 signal recognition particle protein [Microbispora fusca]TYB47374.1 signal recognition particle protein [Microbispora tritici]GLW26998.1 signal recognition particle protein [Microbispora amethystogenes]
MFETLSDRLTSVFSSLRSKGRLSDADIDATCREIRIALLEADVALPVVKDFVARIKERARGAEVSQALNPAQQVVKIVNDELIEVLGGETRRLRFAKNPPTVIMLAGLQGSGKTTLAGKLARWLRDQGHAPLLVACDLQRPNAVQQLAVMAERAGVAVYAPEPGNGVGDPVAVARQSVDHARRQQHDVVIVDTAGRLGIDQELMKQAADIRDAVTPDEVLFVLDAMIGQDAVSTAGAFMEGVGFDGVVLTKLDGDARGGAALSVRHVTGRPIMFASTGEKLEDFDAFHPDRMAGRILDMGDILTLIEQAQKTFDEQEAAKMAGKLVSGDGFTLDDFLEQMMMVRRMGPIKNLLGMMPGMGQMREQLNQVDDRDLDRVAAIIRSMTPGERQDPKIINGSRRARIAKGSGVTVTEVNNLVVRFFEAQKMMKRMTQGMGIPGMPGGRKQKAQKAKKGRRVSGDPRKAALGKAGANASSDGSAEPKLPKGLLGNLGNGGQLPPGLELPPGFDPSKLKLPGQK